MRVGLECLFMEIFFNPLHAFPRRRKSKYYPLQIRKAVNAGIGKLPANVTSISLN